MNCPICKDLPILSVRPIETIHTDCDHPTKEYNLHCPHCPPMYTEWDCNEDNVWEEWEELCKEENK